MCKNVKKAKMQTKNLTNDLFRFDWYFLKKFFKVLLIIIKTKKLGIRFLIITYRISSKLINM